MSKQDNTEKALETLSRMIVQKSHKDGNIPKDIFEKQVLDLKHGNQVKLQQIKIHPDYKSEEIKIIELLHHELYGLFIDVSLEEFTEHFKIDGDICGKIKWLGSEPLIVLLFSKLERERLIVTHQQYLTIMLHFKNKNGKSFNNKQLAVVEQKTAFAKTRNESQIDDIVNIIKSNI